MPCGLFPQLRFPDSPPPPPFFGLIFLTLCDPTVPHPWMISVSRLSFCRAPFFNVMESDPSATLPLTLSSMIFRFFMSHVLGLRAFFLSGHSPPQNSKVDCDSSSFFIYFPIWGFLHDSRHCWNELPHTKVLLLRRLVCVRVLCRHGPIFLFVSYLALSSY